MRTIRLGSHRTRVLARGACCIAIAFTAGCHDAVAPEALPAVVTNTPPPQPPTVTLRSTFTSAAWWGGTAYPLPPFVQVLVGGAPREGVEVQWAVTAGGGIGNAVVVTNRSGVAQAPTWILGPAGNNTLTASVAWPPQSGDSTRMSFTMSALAPPKQVSEYRLVLIDGMPLPPPDPIANRILGGLIRLGDNGTYEYIENDTDLGVQFLELGVGAYSVDHSAIAFSAIPDLDPSRFPADSAVLVGDTLTTTFIKDFEIGGDPAPALIHETYVRVTPTLSTAACAWR